MHPRIDYRAIGNPDVAALARLGQDTSLAPALRALVELRVSQINGCAYCLSLHPAEARRAGVPQLKLDCLSSWRESGLFDPTEAAALAWAESVTEVAVTGVPDDAFVTASEAFGDAALVDLTLIIVRMNALNRLAIGFRNAPRPLD